MAVVPLLVLPLAHVFVPGERLTWAKVAGFAVGFAGVVVLIGPVGGGRRRRPARLHRRVVQLCGRRDHHADGAAGAVSWPSGPAG